MSNRAEKARKGEENGMLRGNVAITPRSTLSFKRNQNSAIKVEQVRDQIYIRSLCNIRIVTVVNAWGVYHFNLQCESHNPLYSSRNRDSNVGKM